MVRWQRLIPSTTYSRSNDWGGDMRVAYVEVFRAILGSPCQHEVTMSLDEIVELLDQHGKRATYGAVAAVVGNSPRSLLRGRDRGRKFSWIVNRETGLPTGYPDDQIDPRLKDSGPVLANDGELRTWLANPS
jgi:hypothetical protein